MDQQQVEGSDSDNNPNNEPNKTAVEWRHVFDWGFWTAHPVAIITLFFGGIFLAAITNFPGGHPKTLWYFAFGLWILLGAIIAWVTSGIVARMEGRELLTNREIEEREQSYRDRVDKRFDTLESDVSSAKQQLLEQQPRRLTAQQRQAIIDAVSPYRGKSIVMMCSLGDDESTSFATELLTVFADAGWVTNGIHGSFVTPIIGSACVGANSGATKEELMARPEFTAVMNILHDIGLSERRTAYLRSDAVPKDGIAIFIAKKPIQSERPPTNETDTQ